MENHGALVGWTHQELGDRIMLRVESVRSIEAADKHEPDLMRFMLTKQQAAILGNYLLHISGKEASNRKKFGLFRRLFS